MDADRSFGGVCAAWSQQRGHQLPAQRIEHQQQTEHVVVVEAMEERELLIAVRLVVRLVDVEHDQVRRRIELVDVASLVVAPQPVEGRVR
jgi:hypothetical protein